MPDFAHGASTGSPSGTGVGRSTKDAWLLLGLAEERRAAGEPERALGLLDRAWELGVDCHLETSIYACAIRALCDLGRHVDAVVLEREHARQADGDFDRAALRLYSELANAGWDGCVTDRREMYALLVASAEERADRATRP